MLDPIKNHFIATFCSSANSGTVNRPIANQDNFKYWIVGSIDYLS